MGQSRFYKENRLGWAEETMVVSERFCDNGEGTQWRIRPMSQAENERIWLRCGGDFSKYERMLLAESVIFPDLQNVELQNSYGVIGAEQLLVHMLTPGEYVALFEAVERIDGKEEC